MERTANENAFYIVIILASLLCYLTYENLVCLTMYFRQIINLGKRHITKDL